MQMKDITEKLNEIEQEPIVVLIQYSVKSIIGQPIELKETPYRGVEKDEYGVPGYFITMKKLRVHIHAHRMNTLSGIGVYRGMIEGGMWAIKDDISAKEQFIEAIKKSIDDYVAKLIISKDSI